MLMKEPTPQPPRPIEGRGASLRLITGFPQDRRTWPNQIAAFKADRRRRSTGPSKEEPVTDSDLMAQFAESLSRLLEGSLGEPDQGDQASPERSLSALQNRAP